MSYRVYSVKFEMNSRYRRERLSCEDCGMTFIRRLNLDKHLLKYHTDRYDFEQNQPMNEENVNRVDDSSNIQTVTTNQSDSNKTKRSSNRRFFQGNDYIQIEQGLFVSDIDIGLSTEAGSKREFTNGDISAKNKIKRVVYLIPAIKTDSALTKPSTDSKISPQHRKIKLGPGIYVPDIEAGSSSGAGSSILTTPSTNSNKSPDQQIETGPGKFVPAVEDGSSNETGSSTLTTPSTNSNKSPDQQIETGPGKFVPAVEDGSSNETGSNLSSTEPCIDPKWKQLSIDPEKLVSILQSGIINQGNVRSGLTEENVRSKLMENLKEIESFIFTTLNDVDN